VSSTDVSPDFGSNPTGTMDAETLSVALIGPDGERRSAVARALAETRRTRVREFDSYPPELDYLHRLQASFDVIMLDLDSDPDVALEIVEKASTSDVAKIMVYSEKADQRLVIRLMRAGAREYLLLPLEPGAVVEALARISSALREKAPAGEMSTGGLLVFVGSKGGSGVTTVACNVAIALAQKPDQRILLIDMALPIGDAALCLGISAGYSTEDAARNIDRLDGSLLENLLVKHRSGVFVLAAPTKVPEVEFSKSTIDTLIAVARREFDQVIVDVGSRIDETAKVLFEDASTIYLITQTGISELRNSNRLISQFFSEGSPNLQIVVNRFDSRFHETVNEEVVAKALGRPVRWKIPNDQDAARALQSGDTGLSETRISRISEEMASSIIGHPVEQEWKMDFSHRVSSRNITQVNSGNDEQPNATTTPSTDVRVTPTITWPAPDQISYGDKLTFAQLNATASVAGTLVYTPGPGYVLPVGTHTLWVTFTPEDSGNCALQQAAVSVVVAKATPALIWRTPAAIICGTALDEAQLNASAQIEGRFNYSHSAGEVFPAGTHTLSVTFTPADSASYTTAEATVALAVVKATTELQWARPDPIAYGTQLDNTQLSAVSPVQGTFEYHPGAGAVLAAGEHRLSVVFTPADTLSCSGSQTTVQLTVTKAAPAITWPTPQPIVSGAALSATQLNASAKVPGAFTYTPAAGEIIEPGVHELSVDFTPTDSLNYTSARAVVLLTVDAKSSPLITWPGPSTIAYGTALDDTHLNATASVPGRFVYTPSAGHILAPGRYTLSALFTPLDTEKYAAAQAAVVLEVEGPSEIASSPARASETQSPRTLFAINSALEKSTQGGGMTERNGASTNPRETRMYKGALYEKGEDGQWHLQKK
jgi:Flp pilus assembly CpaE family ATPase